MKTTATMLAAAAVIGLGASSAASAGTINVGGVVWDPDSALDLQVQSLNMRETAVTGVGDELSGAGQVGGINGDLGFCPGCHLTFTFDGYTVSRIEDNQVAFTGGSIDFWVDNTESFDATDPGTWGAGAHWLEVAGVDHIRGTFFEGEEVATLFGNFTGTIADPEDGSDGFGLLDVVGGLAAPYIVSGDIHELFETGLNGFADLGFSSEFQRDNAVEGYPIGGTATLRGESQRVPEPGSMALLGLGLLFMGLVLYRRRGDA